MIGRSRPSWAGSEPTRTLSSKTRPQSQRSPSAQRAQQKYAPSRTTRDAIAISAPHPSQNSTPSIQPMIHLRGARRRRNQDDRLPPSYARFELQPRGSHHGLGQTISVIIHAPASADMARVTMLLDSYSVLGFQIIATSTLAASPVTSGWPTSRPPGISWAHRNGSKPGPGSHQACRPHEQSGWDAAQFDCGRLAKQGGLLRCQLLPTTIRRVGTPPRMDRFRGR